MLNAIQDSNYWLHCSTIFINITIFLRFISQCRMSVSVVEFQTKVRRNDVIQHPIKRCLLDTFSTKIKFTIEMHRPVELHTNSY